jgi:hypothetical protein
MGAGDEGQDAAMTTGTRRGRRRIASPPAALLLGAVVLALGGLSVPLAASAHQSISGGTLPIGVVFGVVGFVVAWRKPGNRLGWLILGAVLFLAVQGDASAYVVADYRLHQGSLPLGWLAVLVQPSWAPAIVLFGLAVLLFPDGRLPSPRWRWVLGLYLAVAGLWMAGAFALSVAAIGARDIHVDSGGNLLVLSHPAGGAAWWGTVQDLFFPLLGVCWLASVAGQVVSYRRSSGERRMQLKWLIGGSAIGVAGGVLTVSQSGNPVVSGIGFAGVLALPLSMGVAILRYRLYDIDRIISRTLAYAIVTGLLVGVYAGLVLLATQVLPFSGPVPVAVATLVAAALFTPLRRRVQRAVDRRFNRARYDADAAVAAFAAHLQDAVDLGTVQRDLLAAVHDALEPAQSAVWLAGGTR